MKKTLILLIFLFLSSPLVILKGDGYLSGYIALIIVVGTMFVILYLLVIATFLIRKLIATKYDVPKVSLTTHKYILIGIGIVFGIGFVLFLVKLVPAILAVLCLYLFFRYVCPFIWKRLLA